MSETEGTQPRPERPWEDFGASKPFISGSKPIPLASDFPEDNRSGHDVMVSDPLLRFYARYRSLGIQVAGADLHLGMAVAKRFAGRLENDGGLAIGALLAKGRVVEDSDLESLASDKAPKWVGAIVRRRPRGGDTLLLGTSQVDEYGTFIRLSMPMSVGFVDMIVDQCASRSWELPKTLSFRGIVTKMDKIAVMGGPPAAVIPLRWQGFKPDEREFDGDEIEDGVGEPPMVPLFGSTVSTMQPNPDRADLAAAFKNAQTLVGALSPVVKPGMPGPEIGRQRDPKLMSKLDNTPRFSQSPAPTRY